MGLGKGSIESILVCVYVDDLSIAQNNIKAGCYGEVHLMIADDICVLSKCTRVAKYIWCVSGLCRIALELFPTALQLFVRSLRLRAQTAVTPLLGLDGQNVKPVNYHKYLAIVLDTEFSDDKEIRRQLRYQHCAANKLRTTFSPCSGVVKNVFFRSFCTVMYASQLWCNFFTIMVNVMHAGIACCL